MDKQGLGRESDRRAAWEPTYPHPLVSCMMPGIAILAVLAIGLLGFHFWQSTLPADVTVPMIEGLPENDALTQLKKAGLTADVIKERQASETIPDGSIVSADPAGGRHVKAGRVVRLILSAGSSYTTIPDVRELPEAEALDRIKSLGLTPGKENYANHPTIPFGRVINTTPKAGAHVNKQSSVALVISKGPVEKVGALKNTVISVRMPNDGEPSANVRIEVTDDEGVRTVYDHDCQAGYTLTQSVQGKGQVTARVYYGQRMVLERTF